jgi:triosephosphate isomerase
VKQRRLHVAGNWKMNTNRDAAVKLAAALADRVGAVAEADMTVCPPHPYLCAVHDVLAGSKVAVGAQNVYFEPSGAFTGEVSVSMLADCGCAYVIVGHSERRHVLGEDDQLVNRKLTSVLNGGLKPILCVGETLEQREAGKTHEVVQTQIRHGLTGIMPEQFREVTVAYEPVWAIGTGKVATPDQAEEVHAFVRETLTRLYGADLAQATTIQYGGSVKPDNAHGLLAKPNVDGALVGGASLKAEDFAGIVHAAVAVSQA